MTRKMYRLLRLLAQSFQRPMTSGSIGDISPRHCKARGPALFRGKGDRRPLIIAGSYSAVGEDLVPCDPVERFFEHLFRIGLEHNPFSRPPAPRIHAGMKTVGEFILVVVCVAFGPQVDVALRRAQRAEVTPDILRVG